MAMAEMHEEHSCSPAQAARRRRRARRAAVAAGLAIATAAALSAAGTASAAPLTGQPGRVVPALALGLNAAPWDYIYAADVSAGGGLDVIQPLLKAADIGLLRYGGARVAHTPSW